MFTELGFPCRGFATLLRVQDEQHMLAATTAASLARAVASSNNISINSK